ncbi:hypothetical protein NF212_07585 [Parasalinivibrio latis]|uniref:PepSY domain-containing protein n=1 Tax=Parasalinivibrio latis TaxID=2952610 RepID=UPI0030DE2407
MKKMTVAILFVSLTLLTNLAGASPHLKYDEDWDEVKAAVDDGAIRPYNELLEKLNSLNPKAKIVKVEVEEEDGIWIYEIRMLDQRRNVVKMELNASTLEILSVKGHNLEKFFADYFRKSTEQ